MVLDQLLHDVHDLLGLGRVVVNDGDGKNIAALIGVYDIPPVFYLQIPGLLRETLLHAAVIDKGNKGIVNISHISACLEAVLGALLEKGWIIAVSEEKGSRKKEYLITAQGKAMLRAEIIRLEELIENGNRILEV